MGSTHSKQEHNLNKTMVEIQKIERKGLRKFFPNEASQEALTQRTEAFNEGSSFGATDVGIGMHLLSKEKGSALFSGAKASAMARSGYSIAAQENKLKADLMWENVNVHAKTVKTMAETDKEYNRKLRAEYESSHITIDGVGKAIGASLKSSLGSSIEGIIKGTMNIGDAFKNILDQMLSNIITYMANQVVQQFMMSFMTGGMGGGGFISSILEGFLGFNSGTSLSGVGYYASGSMAKGSDTIPSMLSPGEIVLDRNASDIFRASMGRGAMGGPGVIIINSYPSLLGSREEMIALQSGLDNPNIAIAAARRKG